MAAVDQSHLAKLRRPPSDRQAGADVEEKALAEALRQGPAGFGDAKVGVELWLYPPTRRALDIDNRAKAVLDMLQDAKVFDDDNQVDVLIIQRGEIQKGGRAVVKVWKLDP